MRHLALSFCNLYPWSSAGSSYAHKETRSARTPTALPTGQVNPSHAAPSCSAVPVALVGSQHQARHCPALKIKAKNRPFIYTTINNSIHRQWSVLKKTHSSKWFPKLLFCLLSTCAKFRHGGNLATQSKQHQVTSSRLLPCACRTCQCFTSYHSTLLVIVLYFQVHPVVIHPNAVGHRSQPFAYQISSNFNL